MKGNRRVHDASYFSVYADTWDNVIIKGMAQAEKIESLSRGVLVKAEIKVGKYIKDTPLETITERQKTVYAVYKTIDGAKSTRIKIPFMRTDVSDDVAESVLNSMDPALIMKNTTGTDSVVYATNILMDTYSAKRSKEAAGTVGRTNVTDGGVDGYLGQEVAEPVVN
jgi:hypothetical protein